MGHLVPAGTGFHANRIGEMAKVAPEPLSLETAAEESNGEPETEAETEGEAE